MRLELYKARNGTPVRKSDPLSMIGKTVRKAFSLIASFVLLFLLSGCNTVSGFGKDVQKVGKKMESAADRHIR